MSENYWTRRVSRRSVLVGSAGLAAAALIGCSAGDGTTDGGQAPKDQGASSGTAPAVTGAEALPRAPGYPGKDFGLAPINPNPRVLGGTLRLPSSFSGREHDPDRSNAGSVNEWVNDRLTVPAGAGWTTAVAPDLLASYEFVDKTTIVLKLRPGIKTQNKPPVNGRIFNAEDVAYSIMRKAGKLDPEESKNYSRRGQFEGLDKAEAIDATTVKITMAKPNGSIMSAFADSRASIIPKDADSVGYKDVTKVPGTGPWIAQEHIEGTRDVLVANPDYYRTDNEGGRPSFQKVEMILYPDRAAQIAAFITGDVDVLTAVRDFEDAQVRASVPNQLQYTSPSAAIEHLSINPLRVPAWKDSRVRRAWHLALDFKDLGDPLSKAGWLYSGPLHPMYPEAFTSAQIQAMPGYNPATKQKDRQEAAKLLEAAGYPQGDGLSWKHLLYSQTGAFFDTTVRIKDQMSKLFPKLKMEITQVPDFATYTRLKAARDYEGTNYNFAAVPDVALDALTYYHTKGGRNYGSFSEPWADEAIEKALATESSEERKEILKGFQQRYIDEGPAHLSLFVLFSDHRFQPTMGGIDMISGTWHYFYGFTGYGGMQRWTWRTAKK